MTDENDEIINEKDTEFETDEEIVEEAGLNEKLKKLREELKVCQMEKADYLAGWQRAKADFINARRDEDKLRGEFAKYAAEKVLREMLAVADSLEKIGNPADNKTSQACKADINAIYKQLIEILKREGAVQIEAKGIIFNPMYHEALGEVETKNKEENNVILEELQKGYMMYDRVLRPSKVKVGHYQ
ncbi:nucleotide exchange factor GrpE [Candidatus Giovannonibacteria bacterium RIFCSPHIGHO2_02_43_13]|uniref:Protein GrpE n=1 Tax=Candidatus Giovannonibacteria bacterium RIFCSPHIGHO2_02_43_13 TaxID=1798330 RepID=A0A1F5WPT0_9BACT|nr:MAG: Protein GrpE [Parcubacteria group bacterium GW2011_GWA2_44_13]OGF72373.1 MAG: nucleotide exchange factor GrpE [Candidatus Giovannonibacteria bacterium RIFCSPHIGHO2_12_FULL_44_42]OGF77630.1 MAG: nucleotide exchange factor GrpE [Candidatus Giovannonibacteria bacterium RIFCSPHIGHO2_02_43_13]OGF88617.1 MAG: nucleotide exchange factor GrpE [Candidatus Giovannonibacteria bacterium RIFCSPLOWO2_02_FULL_43_54]OGF97016.1 MAG: nucleotide exchange factor GrpE [Candidatus Giovannonibacteria bacteriu